MEIGNIVACFFIAGILGYAIRRSYNKFADIQKEGGAACGCSGCSISCGNHTQSQGSQCDGAHSDLHIYNRMMDK